MDAVQHSKDVGSLGQPSDVIDALQGDVTEENNSSASNGKKDEAKFLFETADELRGKADKSEKLARKKQKTQDMCAEDEEANARKQLPLLLQNTPLEKGLSFGHQDDKVDFDSRAPRHWENGNLMTWENHVEWTECNTPQSCSFLELQFPLKTNHGWTACSLEKGREGQ